MNKTKTYEDACKLLGIDPTIKMDVSGLPESEQKYFIANYKLMIIARALNAGWIPNWKSGTEIKWFPFFDMDHESASGFGFSDSIFGDWDASTYCGSRLCFKTEELADYAGKQFEDLYKDLFTL